MPTNFPGLCVRCREQNYDLIVIDLQFGLTFSSKVALFLLARLGNESPIRMAQYFSNVDMREARTKKAKVVIYIRAKRSAYSPLPLKVGHGVQGRETFVGSSVRRQIFLIQ